MKILLGFRQDFWKGRVVESYARSVLRELRAKGCDVTAYGEGHRLVSLQEAPNKYDLILELDNGRNAQGELGLQVEHYGNQFSCPKAVWFIDSHGQPSLHKRLAVHYDYVFFAVYSKRDLFAKHRAAIWCPNATDSNWFNDSLFPDAEIKFDFGFIGSKHGLHRAKPLIEICDHQIWSYDVRQVSKAFRHKFPHSCEAMRACRILFNHGQKHDGPNLRVVESMACKRPLITDVDPLDGMSNLFEEGKHYIGYSAYTYDDLEEKMKWALDNPQEAEKIAQNGYTEVMNKHLVKHRVQQMLEAIR